MTPEEEKYIDLHWKRRNAKNSAKNPLTTVQEEESLESKEKSLGTDEI